MPSSNATFSLQVMLGYGVDSKTEAKLNKACPSHNNGTFAEMENFFSRTYTSLTNNISLTTSPSESNDAKTTNTTVPQDQFFVASASNVHLTMDPQELFWKSSTNRLMVFIPPQIIGACLEQHISSINPSGSSFWIKSPVSGNFANDLLPRIHSSLVKCTIRGIVMTSLAENGPADILLLEVPKGLTVHEILRQTNGESLAASSSSILKILPLTAVKFVDDDKDSPASSPSSTTTTSAATAASLAYLRSEQTNQRAVIISTRPLLPTCPVCIHRIDPIRLGLPAPTNEHICSRFCPSPFSTTWTVYGSSSNDNHICTKQKFLHKWPLPSRCKACSIIREYWDFHKSTRERSDEVGDLFCEDCSMHKTLWTCLTCGFVGCGRYSNKHSVAHFEQTRHPYSLELATLRVWDYCLGEYGGFVQRPDLLECPSSPPLCHPWMIRGLDMDGSSYESERRSRGEANGVVAHGNTVPSMEIEKSSKKAVMIGEEYEALLQSALEDQAQHYEGEITKLRAELTATLVDKSNMSPEETKEFAQVTADIEKIRNDIDVASKALLEAQAQEAGLRATSQRLLLEQQESNELLKKIQEEHKRENEQGKMQIEDLEQQIADLSANLRMRQQFSQNDELNNAQIFGTVASPNTKQPSVSRRGKKKGRMFRK
ncbi:zinc finger type UBF domain containing protein [Nitzschia inconspicua]|uniref:Zinc finger type UBF domain containing protein n=1 Tax=Nitzschia inconspicua TaxID=303405 RepID=A0A9K3Q4Z1_9STRA|nr:zinc finger type UBF domain containing protein [Nitzschia inconspicua]